MSTNFSVGTYNIDGLSITFTTPASLTKELVDKIIVNQSKETNEAAPHEVLAGFESPKIGGLPSSLINAYTYNVFSLDK